jgi:hypothetical protein
MIPLAISIGASIFPHDGDSYETLLATADSRMYRDKTRRKRQATPPDRNGDLGEPPVKPTSPTASLSELDLKRAATGIL